MKASPTTPSQPNETERRAHQYEIFKLNKQLRDIPVGTDEFRTARENLQARIDDFKRLYPQ